MEYLISFLIGGAICAVVQLLFEGVKEAVDKRGFIGIFYGGMERAAVGISGALVISFLASLVFKPKMKG